MVMIEKYLIYRTKNVFISCLVCTVRIVLPGPVRTYQQIEQICKKLSLYYLDNRDISRKHLWKDGIHLVVSENIILGNISISYLSKIYHPRVFT